MMFRKLLPIVFAVCAIVSSFVAPVLSSSGDIANADQQAASVALATQASVSAAKPGVVQLIDLAGFKKLLTRDKQAKPLLVNFWATWCDPCRDEFPDLVKIDQDFRSKGLDFIAISLDDAADIKTAVPEFLQQVKATMPIYLLNVSDPEPAIIAVDKEWGGALPATFLYDAQGQVVFKHFGRVKTPELRSAIEKVMSGKEK
jgi:thiol-disulfide isomerase/thioredoxin